jgi:hypothetical protein
VAGALGAVLLVGTALLSSSPVGAQTPQRAASTTTAPLANITFNVVRPAFATYYQQHGGVRTFGSPLSNDFQLLGLRVQILQNQVLQQHPDGSITAMDLLNKAMPLARADGYTYPTPDPDMSAAVPSLTSPTYVDDALASIDSGWFDQQVPDTWNDGTNDQSVNFNTAFRSTITCDDLPAGMPCDDRTLLRGALDVWGLPISPLASDPNDPSHVYQRFQRGIMHYSAYDGSTSAIQVGDYFRRVLQDQGVPDDLRADLTGSRFLGEYAPSQPLGVARALDLPATSLTAAFSDAGSDSSSTTTSTTTGPFDTSATSATGANTVATPGTPSSTTPFGAALPGFGQTTDPSLTSGTPTAVLPSASATSAAATSGTPVAASTTPSAAAASTGPDPCAGDEQIMFSPNKPYANTDVLVSVTSARHHTSSTVRLTGPVKPGAVTERQGLNGWVWEWTVTPSVEGWYEFSFFTDGARKCATSGFNVLPAFGTTATATPAAVATLAPVTTSATSTPTPTTAAPSISGTNPPSGGACQGSVLQLTGSNFGTSQSELQGQVIMNIPGGSRAATVLVWTSNSIMVTLPTPLAAGDYQVFVATTGGTSAPLTYKVGAC